VLLAFLLKKPKDTHMNQELIQAARNVRDNAHTPYSNFQVGAAVRTSSGTIFVGCNVENAAYPEGTCAEAGAIAAMCAAGEYEISEVAVIAGGSRPVPPCGGCRQKLAEFSTGDVSVTMVAMDGSMQATTVADLLPGAFDIDHLKAGAMVPAP
jgi:cytidine deaminase